MIDVNYQQVEEFLKENEITDYKIIKIAGDCSFRSYYRISLSENVAQNLAKKFAAQSKELRELILMFAPPSHEDIKPFERVDNFLLQNGFLAPKIFARSEKFGFLLLQDFGDVSFNKALKNASADELELYQKATKVLLDLTKISAPKDLPIYNHFILFRELMVFVDWYVKLKNKAMSLEEMQIFKSEFFDLFDKLSKENQVVVLRDYHADNLMFLSQNSEQNQVGLLDFQDAVIGSPAYDLVSLLEDARRDVTPKIRQEIFDQYLQNYPFDQKQFEIDYAILSLQRNVKILGIFARMSLLYGKPQYLELLPRVLDFVERRLDENKELFAKISPLIKKFL